MHFKKKNDLIRSTLLIVALWFVLYHGTRLIADDSNSHDIYIDLIFFPSGLRVLGFLIWREKVILGLFLGALLTNFIYHPDLTIFQNISISLGSAMSAPLTCYLFEYFSKIKLLSESLKFTHLIGLCILYALINACLHFLEFFLLKLELNYEIAHFLEMFLGDINGVLVSILILKSFILLLKYVHKRNTSL